MNAAVQTGVIDHYRAAFGDSVGGAADAVSAARSAAFAHFESLGFPSPREEAWKYTSLRRLESRRYPAASAGPAAPATGEAGTVRVVDGRLAALGPLPHGLRVRTLAEAVADGEAPASLLRVPVGGGTERFAALNAAFAPEPLVIDVEDGCVVEAPLHVVLEARRPSAVSYPRLAIRLGRGASARFALEHRGDDEERFVNSCLDIEIGPDARAELCRLQGHGDRTFVIERIEATLAQRATLAVHEAALGGGQSRLDLHARLAAPGSGFSAHGLFLSDGARHHDTHVRVDHFAPATTSEMDFRGIAAARGRGVWIGKAVVHPGAQGTRARQASRNLLLSAGAEIDTRPELEIYADDVQCSHGATTGQLDPAALFYLRSRGLDASSARAALTRAFAAPVLARATVTDHVERVRARLDDRFATLLSGAA
ncbi:MAG: Fe-S cluster assembly protein SufD [Steroidobacteraceae bacterium]